MSAVEFVEFNRDNTPLSDAQIEMVRRGTLACVELLSELDGGVVASILQSVLMTILHNFEHPAWVWASIQKEVGAEMARQARSDCAGTA